MGAVLADDIDSNVEGAQAATEQANRQLVKAATSQKSGTTMVSFQMVVLLKLLGHQRCEILKSNLLKV